MDIGRVDGVHELNKRALEDGAQGWLFVDDALALVIVRLSIERVGRGY